MLPLVPRKSDEDVVVTVGSPRLSDRWISTGQDRVGHEQASAIPEKHLKPFLVLFFAICLACK